jgi:hypothetical protein
LYCTCLKIILMPPICMNAGSNICWLLRCFYCISVLTGNVTLVLRYPIHFYLPITIHCASIFTSSGCEHSILVVYYVDGICLLVHVKIKERRCDISFYYWSTELNTVSNISFYSWSMELNTVSKQRFWVQLPLSQFR